MPYFERLARRIALPFLMLIAVLCSASCAEEPSFKMPIYPDAEPPAARSRVEVEKLLAGAVKPSASEGEEKALRVVLVAGVKDHKKGEHDYPSWLNVWSRLLAEAPKTVVDTAFEFPSADQIEKADVIVFYHRGRWDDERAKLIDPYLARGGGLVYIHWAVDGRGEQEEFAKRIGLASLGGSIKFRHGELDVDFGPGREHPIARNFDNLRWVDESYWSLTGDPTKINLIATGREDGEPQPLFWTVEHGQGRVFVSIPGHFAWTFDDPAFRLLILRGIAWVGHRDVDRFNDLIWRDARVE